MTAFCTKSCQHLKLLTTFSYLCGGSGTGSRRVPKSLPSLNGSITKVCQPKAFIMSSARVQSSRPSLDEIKSVKDKHLNMELNAKRLLYKCKHNYVTLADVPVWGEYFVQEKVGPVTVEGQKYEVNQELNSKVSLWSGDITALEIDSIVNAANSSLLGGGGVDGAIHSAAGKSLFEECRELKGCPEGLAKITGGYKLPSKYVIHTVGPQGEKPEVLRSCYSTSLNLLIKNQLTSIAFPCIATGIYGYPRKQAAEVALQTVRETLEKNSAKIDRVIFTVFLMEDKTVYEELMQKYFPLQ